MCVVKRWKRRPCCAGLADAKFFRQEALRRAVARWRDCPAQRGPLCDLLSLSRLHRLQAGQVIGGALRVCCGGEDRPLVVFQSIRLAAQKQRVLLIDADPQQTASQWASLRDDTPFTVASLARPHMARDALRLSADYAYTIIDGPARGKDIAHSVVIASDVVIVPIEPGGPSVWAEAEIIAAVSNGRALKETLDAAFLISRKHGNTVQRRAGTAEWVEHQPIRRTECRDQGL